METPKIGKVLIDRLELVDSRSINVSGGKFEIHVENIIFYFNFKEDKNGKTYTLIEKQGDNAFEVTFYSFREWRLHILEPTDIGVIDNTTYSFSVSCTPGFQRAQKVVIFNLLKEVKNDN